jgi:hypothetical protein
MWHLRGQALACVGAAFYRRDLMSLGIRSLPVAVLMIVLAVGYRSTGGVHVMKSVRQGFAALRRSFAPMRSRHEKRTAGLRGAPPELRADAITS